MQIPLQQFEQYIDDTILQRGRSYFKNGAVGQIEEITDGLYEAIVEGTENYTVKLYLKNQNITEYLCDCPYDYGPVCKHIVAAIFRLQHENCELPENSGQRKKAPGKKSGRKTVAEQVDELLAKLSHDELKEFIKEQTTNEPSFRRILLSTFAHLNKGESKAFYKQQIKAILNTAGGRDRFIDWRAVRYVGGAVYDLLLTAEKHYENGNTQSAIFISCAVLEEMTKALQYADDSNADIGDNVRAALSLLFEIATKEPPPDTQQQLFIYALQAYNKKIFSEWDWHLDMLDLAAMVFKNEQQAGQIIALLDEARHSEYELEQAQCIKLQIIQKTQGEKATEKFMEQHLANPSFRKEAIVKALASKDYEKAIALALDGIKLGARKKADQLIETLRAKYPQRRALLEELGNV